MEAHPPRIVAFHEPRKHLAHGLNVELPRGPVPVRL